MRSRVVVGRGGAAFWILVAAAAGSVGSPADGATIVPGDLVVADQGDAVFRVDPDTGERKVLSSSEVGSGPLFQSPIDVSIEADGQVLVTGSGGVLLRVDPESGDRTVVSSAAVGSGPNISLFHSTVLQSDGTILVAAIFEDAVFKVDPITGDRTEVSSSTRGTGPILDSPGFLALGATDNEIYATVTRTAEVFRVDATSGDRSLVSSSDRGTGPSLGSLYDITVAPDGRILVANGGGPGSSPAVLSIDPVTGDRTAVSSGALGIGSGPTFGRPQSLAVQDDGSIVVADGGTASLLLVDPTSGNRVVLSSSAVGDGQGFLEPLGLAIASIPEPSSVLLFATGLVALAWRVRKKLKA